MSNKQINDRQRLNNPIDTLAFNPCNANGNCIDPGYFGTQYPSVYYDPATVITQQGQQIANNQQDILKIYHLNHEQAKHIQMIDQKIRKSKKIINQQKLVEGDGNLLAVSCFSDGSNNAQDLFSFPCGCLDIAIVVYEKSGAETDIFLITNYRNMFLVGKKKKVSGRYLYEKFLTAGWTFNSQLKKSKVEDLLSAYFVPKIFATDKRYSISELSGWDSGYKYRTADDYKGMDRREFPALPVFEKRFLFNSQKLNYQKYFQCFDNIADEKVKIVLAVFPVIGLLNTVIKQEVPASDIIVNFVLLENMDARVLNLFLKTFERKKLAFHSIELSTKRIEKILSGSNDETLLFDCYNLTSNEYYRRKKMEEHIAFICDICTGKRLLSSDIVDRDMNTALAFVSGRSLMRPDVVNLYVEEGIFERDYSKELGLIQREDIIEGFFVILIHFVEQHMELVQCEIQRIWNQGNQSEYAILEIAYGVSKLFWRSVGLDLNTCLNLSAEPDFEKLFNQNVFDEDELQEELIRLIRKGLANYKIQNIKLVTEYDPYVILYNHEYLWIPVRVFDEILLKVGLSQEKNSFLEMARAKNMIKTDQKSFSRRLQIGQRRFETIQFYRSCLVNEGFADIIELSGGEKKNA